MSADNVCSWQIVQKKNLAEKWSVKCDIFRKISQLRTLSANTPAGQRGFSYFITLPFIFISHEKHSWKNQCWSNGGCVLMITFLKSLSLDYTEQVFFFLLCKMIKMKKIKTLELAFLCWLCSFSIWIINIDEGYYMRPVL